MVCIDKQDDSSLLSATNKALEDGVVDEQEITSLAHRIFHSNEIDADTLAALTTLQESVQQRTAEFRAPEAPADDLQPRGLFHNLKGDVIAGTLLSLIAIPSFIVFGTLTFAPLGPEYAHVGVTAGIYGGAMLLVIGALSSGSKFVLNTPKPVPALLMSAMVAELVARGDALPAEIITLTFLALFLAGLMQWLLGLMSLGALISLVSFPALAGFVNAAAIIMVILQIPAILGLGGLSDIPGLFNGQANVDWFTVTIAAACVLMTVATPLLNKSIPPLLVGFIAGTVFFYLLGSLFDVDIAGATVGAIPSALPTLDQLPAMYNIVFEAHTGPLIVSVVLPTAIAVGALNAINGLMGAAAMDVVTGDRHNSNRELVSEGLANMASSAFGGIGGSASYPVTFGAYQVGGRSNLVGIVTGVACVLSILLLSGLVEQLPLVVLAALLVVIGLQMFDPWSISLLGTWFREKRLPRSEQVSAIIMLSVVVVAFSVNLAAAVLAGVLLSALVFVYRLGANSTTRMSQPLRMDRHSHPPHVEKLFSTHADKVASLHLPAILFYAGAERLRNELDEARSAGAEIIILDLGLVTYVDSTAVRTIDQIATSYPNSLQLILCAIPEAIGESLQRLATQPNVQFASDYESAIGIAETAVIERHAPGYLYAQLMTSDVLDNFQPDKEQ